ncbi:YafY family protein [Apibacter sp. HY039]|uniref:helix-turn-helix transcriptional regulator n=1 Tax=Apibacter sp. HY039 TaxID=2501476 RepID=UPI000FEB6574|nr:YafY family protein [Apibacter sp. HY039]
MNDESLKRFNRIISIMTFLQSKKIIKAQDLASRFDVSIRTIYRDIRSLEKAGIPIVSEAGTGYSIMEGYRLPPVMFSKEEALSFITAEKLMTKFTDQGIGAHYASAMVKIKSVLRSSQKDAVSRIENRIDIRSVNSFSGSDIVNSLQIVLESIVAKRQSIIKYKSVTDEITCRTIEPVGIFFQNSFWYIMGYCLLRKDYRQFRTDRILNIIQTDKEFTSTHGELSDYKTEYCTGSKIRVKILVDKLTAKYLVNAKTGFGFISEREVRNQIEMTFQTADINEGFPRWFLSFADYATILEPEELKVTVKNIFYNIKSKHGF